MATSTTSNRVLSTDWSTHPFLLPITAPWGLPLNSSQIAALLQGYKPLEMEDKWFVYADGPDEEGKISVNFFRSWTGFRFAEMKIQVAKDKGDGSDGGEVTGLVWENSPERIKKQDEQEAKQTIIDLCKFLLKANLP